MVVMVPYIIYKDNKGMIKMTILVFITAILIGSITSSIVIRKLNNEKILGKNVCDTCGAELSLIERIPVISYILQQGKCKHCNNKISKTYIIAELLNGITWITIYITKENSIETILYMLITTILIMISIADIKETVIPFEYNIIILILSIVTVVISIENIFTYIAGGLIIPIVLGIIYLISNGNAIGGGDVKLQLALGVLLGLKGSLIQFYSACIIAVIIHFSLLAFKVKGIDKRSLPFGPYLSIGAFISILMIGG